MGRRQYLLVSAMFFALVALLHLVRAVAGWELLLAGREVPPWVSWSLAIVCGSLAGWGLRSSRNYRRIQPRR